MNEKIESLRITSGIDIPDWYDNDRPPVFVRRINREETLEVILPEESYKLSVLKFQENLFSKVKEQIPETLKIVKQSYINDKYTTLKTITVQTRITPEEMEYDIREYRKKEREWNEITDKLEQLNLI